MSKLTTLTAFAVAMLTSISLVQAQATLQGPIPVTAESGPSYRGSNEQPLPGPGLPAPVLEPYGYMEEEYFISGTVDGKPYSTNMIVRKPRDLAKFSGLVAVETIHAAGAIPLWGQRNVWLNGGHAWIAVASQRGALEQHVKATKAPRYANLDIPAATDAATAKGPTGFASDGTTQDKISQAIMTQVGALLKSNPKQGPFAGATVKYLIMGGFSQTGGTTLRYIRDSHAKARLPDGKPLWDGYLPAVSFASELLPATDVPVVHPVAEADLTNYLARAKAAPPDKADSDAPNDRYRHYQVAGMSHGGARVAIDLKNPVIPAAKPGEKDMPSQFPGLEIHNTAATHLVNWVMKGTVPPKAPRIEVANGQIVRDQFGNAKGGLRTPYVDTPTARIDAVPTKQELLPVEKLKATYKSRADYLKQFNAGIDKAVKERYFLPELGKRLKEEEALTAPRF